MGDLPRNGLHVLTDDVEVSALPIAEFSSNGEHIAGIADAKARMVRETNGKVQLAVINGVGNEVHHFPTDFGIFPTQPPLPMLTASFRFQAFLRIVGVMAVHRYFRARTRRRLRRGRFGPMLYRGSIAANRPLTRSIALQTNPFL